MSAPSWPEAEIRAFASIGTGAKDTKDRVPEGKYPFFVRSQTVERINSWSFDGEAVLTAGDGVGTGKVFHYIDGKFDYHQRVYRISNFRSDVSGRYFYYQFSSNFLARIESLTAKSSVDSVRMETIAGMRIPLPSRAEQDRIVAALDDADDFVSTIERLISKKQAVRRGITQRLLSAESALPGFGQVWTESRVRDVISRAFCGPSPTCEERAIRGDEWGVLKTTCSTWEAGWDPTKHKVLPTQFWGQKHLEVRAGDCIITKAGPRHRVGVPAFVTAVQPHIVPSGKMICLRPDPAKIEPGFLALALAEPRTQDYLGERTTGMAESQTNFENADLLGAPIWLPSLLEQRRLLPVLSAADAEIDLLKLRLEKAKAIRQGMVQQLLTGKTRLPVLEAVA